MKRLDVLETIQWAEDEFGSMLTGGPVARRDVLRCVRAGLVKSAGLVLVLDADGAGVDPERFREGFKLTERGRRCLRHGGVLHDAVRL